MIVSAYARALICLFLASPTLADEYVCSDFEHVSHETIGFVAERQGLDWNGGEYRDSNFEAALAADGGTFFLFTGRTPSDQFVECFEIAEQLTPRIDEAFDGTLSQLGKQAPPEVLEMILNSLPAEIRERHRDQFFPTLVTERSVVSGLWTTTVYASALGEPDRSLSAIDLILGQFSECGTSQECYGAFTEFIGED